MEFTCIQLSKGHSHIWGEGERGEILNCSNALQLGVRKSKKNVLFIGILFYPKMALKLMFASIYIGKIEKSIPFQRHPPPSLVKPKQPTTYPLMKMSREKMSRGKFDWLGCSWSPMHKLGRLMMWLLFDDLGSTILKIQRLSSWIFSQMVISIYIAFCLSKNISFPKKT